MLFILSYRPALIVCGGCTSVCFYYLNISGWQCGGHLSNTCWISTESFGPELFHSSASLSSVFLRDTLSKCKFGPERRENKLLSNILLLTLSAPVTFFQVIMGDQM